MNYLESWVTTEPGWGGGGAGSRARVVISSRILGGFPAAGPQPYCVQEEAVLVISLGFMCHRGPWRHRETCEALTGPAISNGNPSGGV